VNGIGMVFSSRIAKEVVEATVPGGRAPSVRRAALRLSRHRRLRRGDRVLSPGAVVGG